MKKKLMPLLLAVLLLNSTLFFTMWLHGRQHQMDRMKELCADSAGQAAEAMESFSQTRVQTDYRYGIGAFHSFLMTWNSCQEGRRRDDFSVISRAYGSLAVTPEKAQAHMDLLLDALRELQADPMGQNGILRLQEFNNAVDHG